MGKLKMVYIEIIRTYNIFKVRELMNKYYPNNEWNMFDIIFRLMTHKFYTDTNGNYLFVYSIKKRKGIIYVSIIGINPKMYGKGISDILFKHLKGMNYKLIGHISVNNQKSINMAKREGFKIIKKEENYYRNGEDAYLVQKDRE